MPTELGNLTKLQVLQLQHPLQLLPPEPSQPPQPAGEVSGPFPLPKWAKGLMGPLTPYLANLLVRPDARRRDGCLPLRLQVGAAQGVGRAARGLLS